MSRYSLKKRSGQRVTKDGVKWSVQDGTGKIYEVIITPPAWTMVFGSDCSVGTLLFTSPAGVRQILTTVEAVIDAGFPVEDQAIVIDVEEISDI